MIETKDLATLQNSLADLTRGICEQVSPKLPQILALAFPTYLEASAKNGRTLGKLHVAVRKAAIDAGFGYSAATRIAGCVTAGRKSGLEMGVQELAAYVLEDLAPLFTAEESREWSSLTWRAKLVAAEKVRREMAEPLDNYAATIMKLARQIERIAELSGMEVATVVKLTAQLSGVAELFVWRIAGGGKRVILTHVMRVSKALNQLEAEATEVPGGG